MQVTVVTADVFPGPREGDDVREITEQRPLPRWLPLMLLLFPVIGWTASISTLRSGESPGLAFTILFGSIFTLVPLLVWTVMRQRVGVPGFTVSADGLRGAAQREEQLVPWDDVHALVWRATGSSINGRPLGQLVAVTDTGEVAVTSHAGDHVFVRRTTRDLLAGDEVPVRLRPEVGGGRRLGDLFGPRQTAEAHPTPPGWTSQPLPPRRRPRRPRADDDAGGPVWPSA